VSANTVYYWSSKGEDSRYGIITSQTAAQEVLGYVAGEMWSRLRKDGGATVCVTKDQQTTGEIIKFSHTVNSLDCNDFPIYSAELEQSMPFSFAHQHQVMLKLAGASPGPLQGRGPN
jgi:hypothetical protein